jgi:hypothetical protein
LYVTVVVVVVVVAPLSDAILPLPLPLPLRTNVTDAFNRKMELLENIPLIITTLDAGDIPTEITGDDTDTIAVDVFIVTYVNDGERPLPSAVDTVNVNVYTDNGNKADDGIVNIDNVVDEMDELQPFNEHATPPPVLVPVDVDVVIHEYVHTYVNDDEPLDDEVASGSYDCEPSTTNVTFGDTNRFPPVILATNADGNIVTE